jgi:hypothetical protein
MPAWLVGATVLLDSSLLCPPAGAQWCSPPPRVPPVSLFGVRVASGSTPCSFSSPIYGWGGHLSLDWRDSSSWCAIVFIDGSCYSNCVACPSSYYSSTISGPSCSRMCCCCCLLPLLQGDDTYHWEVQASSSMSPWKCLYFYCFCLTSVTSWLGPRPNSAHGAYGGPLCYFASFLYGLLGCCSCAPTRATSGSSVSGVVVPWVLDSRAFHTTHNSSSLCSLSPSSAFLFVTTGASDPVLSHGTLRTSCFTVPSISHVPDLNL